MGKISFGNTLVYDDAGGAEVVTAVNIPITKDTWIDKAYSTSNYGSSGSLLLCSHGGTYTYQPVMYFDVSSIPTTSTIKSAKLILNKGGGSSWSQFNVFTIRRMNADWQANTLTWSNKPAFSDACTPYLAIGTQASWVSFDITNMVQDWVNGTYPNYGLMMFSETGASGVSGIREMYIQSSKHENVELRPYVQIEYV